MPKRMLQGVVVSDKQDKTVVVRVDRRFTHPIYKKTIRQSKKYHAHDQNNEYAIGDTVWIEETRPISKLKSWIVTRGLKRISGGSFVPSNRDPQSDRQRNEPSKETLGKGNVNQDPLSGLSPANFGQVYTRLVQRLLASGPTHVDNVAGAQLSLILKRMDTNAIHSRITELLLGLDNPDKQKVTDALTTLSIVLPRLDLKACMRDPELRKTLYIVPDRLMEALTENLDTAAAAKKAAFALVAAIYPHHYSGDQLAADEKTALNDLQDIFKANNVTSFFTVNTKPATGAASAMEVASIDARLWNGLPFKLNGVRPRLVPSRLFDHYGDFDICQVKGAKKIEVIKIDKKRLGDGQFGGLTARLEPDPNSAVHDKVVLYFGNDNDVYRREVFDLKTLFPKHAL